MPPPARCPADPPPQRDALSRMLPVPLGNMAPAFAISVMMLGVLP